MRRPSERRRLPNRSPSVRRLLGRPVRALPETLSGAATFGYGALGALVALLVVQVRPWGMRLAKGARLHITFPRMLGAFLVLVAYVVAGGIVAMLVGDAIRPKQAIAYGLGWQGLIGGFLQSGRSDSN